MVEAKSEGNAYSAVLSSKPNRVKLPFTTHHSPFEPNEASVTARLREPIYRVHGMVSFELDSAKFGQRCFAKFWSSKNNSTVCQRSCANFLKFVDLSV